MSSERRCEGCQCRMEPSEYLRSTLCLDGALRRLCEECAFEMYAAVNKQRRHQRETDHPEGA